jgi:hypothetical protein
MPRPARIWGKGMGCAHDEVPLALSFHACSAFDRPGTEKKIEPTVLNNVEAIYDKVVFVFLRVTSEIDIVVRGREVYTI